ncbi:orotidine 5'-phosphate decarboxylase [Mesobacillus campisalis]|uniref:Orotidine 5'-phosphate decarboxylase n=1 Tax=Mesobacillus campisalis TaxID=1408103 RepID=A0A0M2T492_9BACI|nr:orotidine-5'-phosphate decarboxylase [Mesobacillus campisalis]KKK39625.1 orotidine 5'-phosphate decarboxylase [Mesobacillus campisalis]
MRNSLIIALDFPAKRQVLDFLQAFGDEKVCVKIGMELFYSEGPDIVSYLKEQGHEVFLDLKLHDIPNTVRSAMKSLASLGADMVNVHAAGGQEMMEAALEGLDSGTSSGNRRPLCIAVTQLTSTSEEQMQTQQLIQVPLQESVLHYSKLSADAGLDGVVCSAYEAGMISRHIGAEFLTVTPGIRPASGVAGDQKRVATPQFAREEGASAIVVGRPITKSAAPLESYRSIKKEWEGVLL